MLHQRVLNDDDVDVSFGPEKDHTRIQGSHDEAEKSCAASSTKALITTSAVGIVQPSASERSSEPRWAWNNSFSASEAT